MNTTTTKKPAARRTRTTVPEVTVDHGTSVVDALADTTAAAPQFLLLSPADLTVDEDTNIRKNLHLSDSAEFVESVRELGVLQPIVAYPDPIFDGKYRVEFGHRRAVAAQMVDAAAVPTFIVASPGDADRVAGQLAENIHRAQMSESEQVNAVKQLALFGMPADQIAKKTARPRAVIDAALKVSESANAIEILDAQPDITLVQAAQLLEFEDDPGTYADLVENVIDRPEQIEHIIQMARSDRELAQAMRRRATELRDQGVHVFAEGDTYTGWVVPWNIDLDGGRTPATSEIHDALLPDRAGDLGASIRHYWVGGEHKDVGVDWYVRRDAVDTVDGWKLRSSATSKGPKTDAEKEQARQDRIDKQLWLDATTVRRAFIKDLVTKTTPPKTWPTIVAQYLAGAIEGLDEYGRGDLTGEWLDIEHNSDWRLVSGENIFYRSSELWLEQHPGKAAHYALATALAGFEKHLEKIDATSKPWRARKPNIGPYLAWLNTCGYTPAQIELDIIDADIKRTRKTGKAAA